MEGIGIFPSISLIIFLGFFIGLIVYLVKKGKSHWEDTANIPLEDELVEPIESEESKDNN